MDSTDETQGPLTTLTPSFSPLQLPLNWSAPLSPPPATVVSPLEIISPKPKRLIPNLAAYLEDASDDEKTEEDDFLPRTESPEPMPEFKASPSYSIHPSISNRIIPLRRLHGPNHKSTRHPPPRRPTRQHPQTSPPSQSHSIGSPSRLPYANTVVLAPHSRSPGHSLTGTRKEKTTSIASPIQIRNPPTHALLCHLRLSSGIQWES